MSSKLNKEQKKILKKQKKSQETLFRHENIVCSELPSKFLLIANGGLGNGVSREEIYSLFSHYGNVVNIYMRQRKPYCFVEYANASEADDAMKNINGRELEYFQEISRPDLVFYLSFLDAVPDSALEVQFPEPSGLTIFTGLISAAAEQNLMNCVDWNDLENMKEEQFLKHRKVQHYGFRFDYKMNKVDKENPLKGLPTHCNDILQKLLSQNIITAMPDQLTVNQYLPGQGIPPHVDSHSSFEDEIIIISLGSQVRMDFRNPEGDHSSVVLPIRSVAIMSGDSRCLWTHGMTPRVSDVIHCNGGLTLVKRGTRTSFTFRKVRYSHCQCSYKSLCDSQRETSSTNPQQLRISEGEARILESEHVHKVYDEIADHFSNTRHTPWPRVTEFLSKLEANSLVLDVGCGNGKYLGVRTDIFTVGCDTSQKLCEINVSLKHEVQLSNILQLPYKDDTFDAAICIAVIHHLASEVRRKASVKEICRVVRPGGKVLIYVWAMEQQRNGIKSKYLKKSTDDDDDVKIINDKIKLPVHLNGTTFKNQDTLVPWHLRKCSGRTDDETKGSDNDQQSKVHHRYYHVFTEGELEQLCRSTASIEVWNNFYDQGNWCIEFSLAS